MKQLYLNNILFEGTEEEFLAVEYFVCKEWKLDGKLHREDGPALMFFGFESWYQNGKLHRTDGPAATEPDGTKSWWKCGVRHRLGGPAMERPNGFVKWTYSYGVGFGCDQWWVDGVKICDSMFFPTHLFDMR